MNVLNGIDVIIPILKVIETSKSLMIKFDFENDNVKEMDLMSSSSTYGACLHETGQIYIAAKRSDNEIIGTLAHELCHYAMNIVFNNACQPFTQSNVTAKKLFEEISNCEKRIFILVRKEKRRVDSTSSPNDCLLSR